jgi:UDP-N-acetylglucosamine 2-epimerase (non-hydrolysing)
VKVLSVVGTRPEAIKMAPVINEMARYSDRICQVVCVTAQHRDMLDQMLKVFDIKPDYDLDLMQGDQGLSQLTASLVAGLDAVVAAERPDWLLLQGDTTTAMAASLVGFYRGVKVGHVEAGLRTDDIFQPFPEEINRRIADLVSTVHFAPTEQNRRRLVNEGVAPEGIVVTGNTVVDALVSTVRRVGQRPLSNILRAVDGKRLILVTLHRRENFGAPLKEVCRALREIAYRFRHEIHIVYPVHRNRNIWGPVHQMLGGIPNITLLDPVDYETAVQLLSHSDFVLTDSGGLQEEAPTLHKPVLVLRNVTERQELVEAGGAKLVGTDARLIVQESARLLEDEKYYRRMASVPNPFGDGRASERIVASLLAHCERRRPALAGTDIARNSLHPKVRVT